MLQRSGSLGRRWGRSEDNGAEGSETIWALAGTKQPRPAERKLAKEKAQGARASRRLKPVKPSDRKGQEAQGWGLPWSTWASPWSTLSIQIVHPTSSYYLLHTVSRGPYSFDIGLNGLNTP